VALVEVAYSTIASKISINEIRIADVINNLIRSPRI